MFNLIDAYKAGLFSKNHILPNIISGLVVGVVALPLAMAFAIASGAKPEQGIYTAIIAGFIVAVCGGSRLQIAGPTGAFIVVLVGITNKYGIDGLQVATLLAGCMLFLFGVLKLGMVLRFIPAPVIAGFTAGIAVVIWVGQWQYFFGFHLPQSTHFHSLLWNSLSSLPHINITTTIIAITSLLIVLYTSKLPIINKIPGTLLALVGATILQAIYNFPDVATIGSKFGGIPHVLPSFKIPVVNLNIILELIGPAFTIAMLGAIESLLSAVVADGMSGGPRHNSNRELIGQGIANIAAPLFGGFAATGAIARTATNIRNGGTSPLSAIIHSITLVLIIVFLAPFAIHVPLAALAAILFWVAWNMSHAKHCIKLLKRAPKSDAVILLVTFFLTIFVDLVVAVNIGVMLAVLNFLFKMSKSFEVKCHDHETILTNFNISNLQALPKNILVYSIEGPFFFAGVENFQEALKATHADPEILIFRLGWVPFIDSTALQSLEEVISELQIRKVRVILCGANKAVTKKLQKSGIYDLLGKVNIYNDLNHAIEKVTNIDKSASLVTAII